MLDDILGTATPHAIICGTAVATASAARGHYYAGRGNRFWQLIHESGLTPTRLTPERDHELARLGIGLTDLVKGVAQSHDRGLDYTGGSAVVTTVERSGARWVGFNGVTAARQAARLIGAPHWRAVALGPQEWTLGRARVYVLPSSSGANARLPYAEKLEHWRQFAQLVRAER